MNPDPNQPQEPTQDAAPDTTPTPTETPASYAEAPAASSESTPVVETPAANPLGNTINAEPVVAEAPAPATPETTPAPNPFGAAPISSDATAPTPVAQPAEVSGSTPVGNTTPTKNSKKKLLILIGVIVGALVVLGIIAYVVLSMLNPSKKDYSEATSQFNDVSSAYSDLSSDVSKLSYDFSGSATDTEFTNDTDAVTTKLKTLEDTNAKLAPMKAVKVGDGKKLYDTYESKLNSFVAYSKDLVTSLKSYRPAAKACDSVDTATLLTQCVDALGKVGDLPNADMKQYVTTLQTQFKAYLDVKTKIDAIKDPYGDQYDQYKTLRDQGYDIQDKISSAGSDFSSNISKHNDEVDPASAANALGEFLVKKANG